MCLLHVLKPYYYYTNSPVIIKTTITDTKQKIIKRQKKWGKGINIDPKNINIKDINDFVQFKTLKYKVYNFKDNKL